MACQVHVRTLFFCVFFKDTNEIAMHLTTPDCRLYVFLNDSDTFPQNQQ